MGIGDRLVLLVVEPLFLNVSHRGGSIYIFRLILRKNQYIN